FLHPDDAAETLQRFEQARATGATFLAEHRIRSAAGEYRWFLARGVPQRDAATGRIVRWFGASTDIHDLKIAEGALREADRRKDEFLAMLAHELRNPLAVISNTYWLVKQAATPELDRHLDVLGRQVKRLGALVDDLLDVSRVTRGLVVLQQQRVDLGSVVERAMESLRALLDERAHEVTITQPGRPLFVHGDPARLEQVVVNLLTNACKYTDRGGRITVTLAQAGGQARLEVQDNGIGMAPEVLERIFDLFAQAERGLARSQGGLGIGLTIVRRLVELHGGTVRAESAGLGQGATFTVDLPLDTSQPQQPSPPPTVPAVAGARRILVVDDNVDSAATLALVLELSGHVVQVAHDGMSGVRAALEQRPEVVLLDIGLPDIDGYEVARRLRAEPTLRGCVLVALTGYGQPADRAQGAAAGFDEHFVKPVEIAALEAFLAKLPPR
ncbi:MAG TPA: ATP-binding protein, partial [Ramlibacter sp.]|nr:ATP-binding protein [Ramlibacter sp.]